MKKHTFAILLSATLTITSPIASAQIDAAGALLTAAAGAGGYAIGEQFKDQLEIAPYLGAAIAPALANWGYSAFKSKNEEEKLKFYLSGRNYERWVQSQKVWYQSTLDPYTGRPQAFTGLSEMDRGIDTPLADGNSDINHIFTVPVKVPSGTYGGTPYVERIEPFPKLP